MKSFMLLSTTLFLLITLCGYKNNRYNPQSNSYEKPYLTIDTGASSLPISDTVTLDSGSITLHGNDYNHRNQFRYMLDNDDWSPWGGDGERSYTIPLPNIAPGNHHLKIQVCYNPGNDDYSESTITFFRASPPKISSMSDTMVTLDAGGACTLWVEAAGTGTLTYAWYRNTHEIDAAGAESLVVEDISIADTAAVWYCRVQSKWGNDSSHEIRFKVMLRVYYHGNENTGGDVPEDTCHYRHNDSVFTQGNTGTLSRRGYTFNGWNTESSGGGVPRDSGDRFIIDSTNITLYAVWDPKPAFTLSYNGNGETDGTVPDSMRIYKSGEVITVLGNKGSLQKSGFTFTGWNTLPNGNGTGYQADAQLEMGNENITLYAQWTDIPTFTVMYKGHGAERGDVPETNRYKTGDIVIISGNSGNLAKEGYTFIGWETDTVDNRGTAYNPDDRITMESSNIVLYARWTSNPAYSLTYHSNGGNGIPPKTVTNEAGVTITISGQGSLVKKGFTFTGWNLYADGTGMSFDTGALFTIDTLNDTLYAQWKINQYIVRYNGNNSDGGSLPLPTTHTFNTEVTIAEPGSIARTGYSFYRWNTSINGTGVDYAAGDKFMMGDSDVTLYARWSTNTYYVTFNKNSDHATGTMPNQQITFNASATLSPNAFVNTGYTFDGWATSAAGAAEYADEAIYTMTTEGAALYAKWSPKRYDITFSNNSENATGTMPNQQITFNASATLSPNAYVNTGYTFDGWATSAAGAAEYADEAIYTMTTEGAALYAQWTPTVYSITYSASSDVTHTNPVVYTIETPTIILNAATRPSYTFDGWYDGSVKVTTIATGSTGNRELRASWIITDVDGNIYTEVTIGPQVWMVENLKTTRFRDGAPIPNITDHAAWTALTSPGYCWYNNDSATNKSFYGALYNWYAAADAKIAPAGWHVASDAEWTTLTTLLGGETSAGGKLKEVDTVHWKFPNTGATNESGFTALPGGWRAYVYVEETFYDIRTSGYWWSPQNAACRQINSNNTEVTTMSNYNKASGLSVRCVRDW